ENRWRARDDTRGKNDGRVATPRKRARSTYPCRRRSVRRPAPDVPGRSISIGSSTLGELSRSSSCHPPAAPPHAANRTYLVGHPHADEIGASSHRNFAAVAQPDRLGGRLADHADRRPPSHARNGAGHTPP